MTDTSNNPVAGYLEAQMAGTAGILQAALQGMQRVQEIMLRTMREGAGGQFALARSVAGARDASDIPRAGEAHVGQAAEQFTRYQQELIGAVTAMNNEVIQASYSMMERVGHAVANSAAGMGLPASGTVLGTAGSPMAAFEAGMRQWQSAVERMTQGMGMPSLLASGTGEDEADERTVRKAAARRPGRR
jgi:hypothetical protein